MLPHLVQFLVPFLSVTDVAALGASARGLATYALCERLRLEKHWHLFLAGLLQQSDHYGRLALVVKVLAPTSGLRYKNLFWNAPAVFRCAPLAQLSPAVVRRRVQNVVNLVACCLALRHLPDQTLLTILDHRGLHEERQTLSPAPFGRLVRRETTERLSARSFTIRDLPASAEEAMSVMDLQVCVLRLEGPALACAASPHTIILQPTRGREADTVLRELTVTGGTARPAHVVVRNVRTLRKLVWHTQADSLSVFGTPLAWVELSESVRSLAIVGCHWQPGTVLYVWSHQTEGFELTLERSPYVSELRVRSSSGLLRSLRLLELPCLTAVEGWPLSTAGVAVGSLCAFTCQALRRFQHIIALEQLLLSYCPALASTASEPLSLGPRLNSLALVCCPRIVWLGETWSSLHLSLQYAPGAAPVMLDKGRILSLLVQLPPGWQREVFGGRVVVNKLELRTSEATVLRRANLEVSEELFINTDATLSVLRLRQLGLPRLPPATTIRTGRQDMIDLDGCTGSPTLVRICTGKRCYNVWVPA